MQAESKKYFENLDGLRYLLAFAVFSNHSMLGETINEIVPFDFLKRLVTLFSSGPTGVSFFFVLSGFLITYLMIEEKETTGAFNIKNFYVRRALRIWPLYFTVLFFSFFIYPYIKTKFGYVDQNPRSFIYQLFFLANFDSIRIHNDGLVGVDPSMIGINWSVSVEEQFYLFWPILFLLIKPSRFWIICVLTVVVSLIFRLSTSGANLYYHTLSIISDMAIGGLGAWLAFYSKTFISAVEKCPRYLIVIIYLIGAVLLTYSDLLEGYFVQRSFRILSALFFSLIIIEQSFASHSWYKFGHFKSMSSWGKYTYAFYMLHPIGIQTSIITFRSIGIQRDERILFGLLYVLIALVVSVILSLLSYRFLEGYYLEKRRLFG